MSTESDRHQRRTTHARTYTCIFKRRYVHSDTSQRRAQCHVHAAAARDGQVTASQKKLCAGRPSCPGDCAVAAPSSAAFSSPCHLCHLSVTYMTSLTQVSHPSHITVSHARAHLSIVHIVIPHHLWHPPLRRCETCATPPVSHFPPQRFAFSHFPVLFSVTFSSHGHLYVKSILGGRA